MGHRLFAPDRVDHLVALSVGHPTAFGGAGFDQREKSCTCCSSSSSRSPSNG